MPLIVPTTVVDGESLSAHSLLRTHHCIPPYQRDYVWTRKAVEQLWEDLIQHYQSNEKDDQLPQPAGYFLGAMVMVRGGRGEPAEVVDGQQRLTTLSTIASILYDALQALDVGDARRMGFEQRVREMLGTFDGSAWQGNIRFVDADLRSFFVHSCVELRNKAEKIDYWGQPWCVEKLSRKKSAFFRLKEAVETGYNKLELLLASARDEHGRRERLVSFIRLVTECVVVLRIEAQSYSNAYSIFESLNNRGIPLSQADLIKNELLKSTPSDAEREEVIDTWNEVRQSVDAVDILTSPLPDFLHFSYLSRHGRAKAADLFLKVKTLLTSLSAKEYAAELEEDANALEKLTISFDGSWTEDTMNMLKDMRSVLGIKLIYPLLIAAWRKSHSDPTEFEALVRLAMNFAFRYMKVMEGNIETLANVVSDTAIALMNGATQSEIAATLRRTAPDAQFIEDFESVIFPNTKLAYFAVYYLEKARLQGTLPLTHGEDQNLEHIMPRNPGNGWPEARRAKDKNPEGFKEDLWRIGNLLPLPATINKSLKNVSIDQKIGNGGAKTYTSAELSLVSPKEIGGYLQDGKWTSASIARRQSMLAEKFAVRAWTL